MLILVFGLPGAGKSYFARHLCKEIDAVLLNTDMIREELGIKGKYDEDTKQHVYDEIRTRTAKYLKKGKDIIVDGTFHKIERREDFFRLAAGMKTEIYYIEIRASEKTIKQRLTENRKYSEADYNVYREIKKEFEAKPGCHLVLWSGIESTGKMISKAKRYIYGHQADPCPDK